MFIRKNVRTEKYNYTQPNYYFITICEKFRRPLFSSIINQQNHETSCSGEACEPKSLGSNHNISEACEPSTLEIQTHNSYIDNNKSHFHNAPLVKLTKIGESIETSLQYINNMFIGVSVSDYVIMPNHIHFILILSLSSPQYKSSNKPVAFGQILSTIKSMSLTMCRKEALELDWQTSFYEKIIRNEKELYSIKKYILENPLKWKLDCFNPKYRKFDD